MPAVPFDTLKLARRLEAPVFPGKQAADTAEALADAMSGAEIATTSDLAALGAALKSEMAALSVDLKREMAALSAELKGEMAALRAELRSEMMALRAELKAEIELVRRDMTIRLGGMMVIAVGILLAAIRYLPVSHP